MKNTKDVSLNPNVQGFGRMNVNIEGVGLVQIDVSSKGLEIDVFDKDQDDTSDPVKSLSVSAEALKG